MMWLRQMAQLSTTISQAQRATAFHYDANISHPPFSQHRVVFMCECLCALLTFLTSKRGLPSPLEPFFLATGGASVMSTSAMGLCVVVVVGVLGGLRD